VNGWGYKLLMFMVFRRPKGRQPWRSRLIKSLVTFLTLLMVSCGGDIKDGPPPRDIDVNNIPDAVPRFEPITRAGNKSPYVVLGKKYYVLPSFKNYRDRGKASWYGTKFHGNTTSNGETYNMYSMTAAHKTLPIPCYVQVTNLDNGRRAVVRVNDRGPFHDDRIIDLSYAAAKKLGIFAAGTANVEVVAIDPASFQPGVKAPTTAATGGTFLQVGAFSSPDAAERYRQRAARGASIPAKVEREDASGKTLFKVLVGPFDDHNSMLATKDRLLKHENLPSFVVYR
jgi:peptidoglycan lytic transglycosylase